MNGVPVSIPKQPALTPASDYFALRREGIGHIEQMASAVWTDYNEHDPGVTILEQLCYVLTDLAYRNNWDIKDLLMPAMPGDPAQPYPNQTFFTAREILTVNPVTPDDFRRLLIGREAVRNAWVFCKQCACDVVYYAGCAQGQQVFSFREADAGERARRVDVQGLYEVLLELEADAESGDLNDSKIELDAVFDGSDGARRTLGLELRFPQWELARPAEWRQFLDGGVIINVKLLSLGATRIYDVFTDPALDAAGRERYLQTHWNGVWYLGLELELAGGAKVEVHNVALHLFADNATRNNTTLAILRERMQDIGAGGPVARYRSKSRKAATALADAWSALSAHRNLDEDYCRVAGVAIEDVAVCADIEVAADADIELVQAQAWFRIAQYFNPPVRHYSLQEMQDSAIPVEEIFNGPMPDGGFIKQDELANAGLKAVLRTSDLINLLMDIEGVVAVGSLLLSKYDQDGEQVKGAADPVLGVFDQSKGSAAWQLTMAPLHLPRLYFKRSRFLFFKNGLPLLPRADEAQDTLLQLQGEAERGKIGNAALDFPVPSGSFRNPNSYYPLQYGFPQTYGIGPAGLSHNAGPLRRAQARQLQAYLMVFEQLLANAGEQLAHTADLFSLDPALSRSYFAREFNDAIVGSWSELAPSLTPEALKAMTETPREFHERRNRFLDHLLARFGESFGEYALLLTDTGGERLIGDKIGFLADYPRISRDRGRAGDYTRAPCSPENVPGLKRRIGLLLGFPDLAFNWTMSAPGTVAAYRLDDRQGRSWLAGTFATPFSAASDEAARQMAYEATIARLSQADAYQIAATGATFRVDVSDAGGQPMGSSADPFDRLQEAQAMVGELLSWSSNYRAIIVEHLLLRPKFPGDGLMAPCSEGGCGGCDDADPYSFRLSVVMPGWSAPFNDNLALRGFADRAIAQEVPSHLLAKTCWVGNDGFIVDLCAPVVADVASLLQSEGLTAGGERPGGVQACACAEQLYGSFSAVFNAWYADKTLDYIAPEALEDALTSLFAGAPAATEFSCTTILDDDLFAKVRALMLAHFYSVAQNGWQFERFENAWCAWLEANSAFNWTHERIQDRVHAILLDGLASRPAHARGKQALCTYAATLTTGFGLEFDQWLKSNIAAGRKPADFSAFMPAPVVLAAAFGFEPGTAARVEAMLKERYAAYTLVSYRLRILLALLARLRNTYPGATLHDCDDGSDVNPVRLGSTALGRQPRRPASGPPLPTPDPGMLRTIAPAAAGKKRGKRQNPNK
ncbi:MAG: hypothetical protein V4857_02735 [Pseudomonadota bacterium]